MIKRKLTLETYKKLLNYTCAHPHCEHGQDIEGHHIKPLSKGGEDKYWNIISLCWYCHHKRKLHSHSEEVMTELYVYKSMHEHYTLGFYMDEQEDDFKNNYKKALRECKNFTDDEKFVAQNIYKIKE